MAEEKKKKIWERFLKRYIIVVYNQGNFKERISLSLTPINLILVLSSLVFFTGFLTWLLVVFTPIKSFIPGFNGSSQNAGTVILLQKRVDSFKKVFVQDSMYIHSLIKVLNGDTGKTSYLYHNNRGGIFHMASLQTGQGFASASIPGAKTKTAASTEVPFQLFPPVNGYISQHYNPREEHYAVDIVTGKDAPVKSVDEGMVLFSEWSAETGNVMIIQHANNLISIYKHNSVLLKKVGTFVNRGDVIALVGNSGEFTTGPHLHFELWAEGSPLDPENFISF